MTRLILDAHIYALFDGVNWVDIFSETTGDIICTSGMIGGNGPKDRVAGSGKLTFTLNNNEKNSAALEGYYSPGHANCREGFGAGLKLKVTFTFDGVAYNKWYGMIPANGITVYWGQYKNRMTYVTAYDWMYQASIHRIFSPTVVTNKRGDEMMPLIVANMPIAPLYTNYMVGEDTFPFGFSTNRTQTTAMSEFQKICQSGLYYVYIAHDRDHEEILTFENRLYRNSISPATSIVSPSSDSGYRLTEDGYYRLTEDGNKIILNSTSLYAIDDKMVDLDYQYGNTLINKLNMISNPAKEVGATVLFTLQSSIALEAGETKTGFKFVYRDPNGAATSISAKDVTLSSLVMTQNEDGTGTDRSADLEVLNAVYGSESMTCDLKNNNAAKSWVSTLVLSGTALLIYDTVSRLYEDTDSQTLLGTYEDSIDMKYQSDPIFSDTYGAIITNRNANPYPEAKSISFFTGSSDQNAQIFLSADIASRYPVRETQTGINEDFFIQGWSFTIFGNGKNEDSGNNVSFTWYLKKARLDTFLFAKWDTLGGWDTDYGWNF